MSHEETASTNTERLLDLLGEIAGMSSPVGLILH